jgi:tetratricopeptide (TPR) repeat protein
MELPNVNNQAAAKPSGGKGIYKNRWFWPVIVVLIFIIMGLIIWLAEANNEPESTSNNPIVADYQKQLPDLADAAEDGQDNAKAQANYAVALYATGDVGKAKDQYEKAVQLDPDNATLRNNLGNAYRDLGDYQKAVDSYQKALSLDPKMLNAYMNLANVYLYTLDQPDLAIKTYQDALKNIPGNQELQVLLGTAYEQSGDKAQATATYEAVLQENPNNTGAQAGLKRVQ